MPPYEQVTPSCDPPRPPLWKLSMRNKIGHYQSAEIYGDSIEDVRREAHAIANQYDAIVYTLMQH